MAEIDPSSLLNEPALSIEPPAHPCSGRVTLPGSKSITNRALLLAGLARGRSRLTGALKSDDTRHMATALRQMGVGVDEPDGTTFVVEGRGGLGMSATPLFLGNAGTAVRFLTAAAATVAAETILDGDDHMRRRPIGPLIEALGRMGVDAVAPSGCPPVTVRGPLTGGGEVIVDARLSSQYLSALLMAAPLAQAATTFRLSDARIGAQGYVDLTLAAMRAFGAMVTRIDAGAWRVEPGPYRARDYRIEPDASAATYLWGVEALTGGAVDIGLANADFTQPDAAAHAMIAAFPNMPAVIDGSQMQDAVPTLAVLAMFNAAPVRFVGIANLRVKECDRIAALATELQRLHPDLAREEGDDLIVTPVPDLAASIRPGAIQTYHDHRIAMAFALAGLRLRGITILDPGCVAKTYPGYWRTLRSLGVVLTPAPAFSA